MDSRLPGMGDRHRCGPRPKSFGFTQYLFIETWATEVTAGKARFMEFDKIMRTEGSVAMIEIQWAGSVGRRPHRREFIPGNDMRNKVTLKRFPVNFCPHYLSKVHQSPMFQ
jgi:hypothetical protein